MAVIFTPSFKKAPPASLPPCFSFCFLCSLYFFWFSAQFTLPPITPPFLCSPPLIYCCFRWEREEDATAFFFSSLCCVYISLLALFLLPHTSPGLCLLNLPPFPPPACFGCLSSFWMLIRDTWLRWRSYLPGRGKNRRRRRRGQSFFTIIWAFFWLLRRISNNLCPPILIGCIKGSGSAFVCMEYERFGCYVTWSFTGQAHILTSFGQYRRDFMPQLHPNPQDSHSHRPSHRYMSAARGG